MIALDTNILIFSIRAETEQHAKSRKFVETLAEQSKPWAVPIFCISEFLRVATHPKLFLPSLSIEMAWDVVNQFIQSPSCRVLLPGEQYLTILQQISLELKITGNLIFDAQIAALLIENGIDTIVTEDRDFLQFKMLKVKKASDL